MILTVKDETYLLIKAKMIAFSHLLLVEKNHFDILKVI